MAWVRIDDRFPEHPKVLELSDAAFRLHVHALCYAGRVLTDGRVSRAWLTGGKGRVIPKAVHELTKFGLWRADGDSFLIHDYLEYQPSRAEVGQSRSEKSRKRSEAGKKGASNRWQNDGKPDGKPIATVPSSGNDKAIAPSPPIPKKSDPVTTIALEDLVFRHPRFVVHRAWHAKRVDGLSDTEFGMSNFYKHLATHVDAHPEEDTEPRFDWLTKHFNAWVKGRQPSAASSDVDGVEATRLKISKMMSRHEGMA